MSEQQLTLAPYLPDGPRTTLVVSRLHAEPRSINLPGLIASLILWMIIAIGLTGITFGALEFFLWALDLFGRAAP